MDGNLVISVPATDTGFFEDLVNSDDYDEDDLVNWEFDTTPSGAGTITPGTISAQSEAPAGVVWAMVANPNGNVVNDGETRLHNIVGILENQTTESRAQDRVRLALTWDSLGVRVTVNSLTVATSFVSRIDGADGDQSVSVAAADTGFFEDAVNVDDVASGEQINWETDIPAGAGSITFTLIQSRILGSPITNYLVVSATMTGSGFENRINGSGLSATVEAQAENTMRYDATWRRLTAEIYTNTQGANSTIVSRINEADGNQTVTFAGGATGEFEDNVNTDDVQPGDELNWSETGGNNNNWEGHEQSTLEPDLSFFLAYAGRSSAQAFGLLRFNTLMGAIIQVATELDTQAGSPLAAPGVGGGGVGGSALILFR